MALDCKKLEASHKKFLSQLIAMIKVKQRINRDTKIVQAFMKIKVNQKIILQMFMYVSTCYCHLKEKVLYEKFYAPPKDPHKIIELVEGLSVEEAEKYRDEVLEHYPNTYAFSKALAEGLINEARDKENLKALLIRPSIIISTVRDPIEGRIFYFKG